jgi:hypothetical protein
MIEIGVYVASLLGTIYYAIGDSGQKAKIMVIVLYLISLALVWPQIVGSPYPTGAQLAGMGMEIVLLIFFVLKFQYLDRM